MSCCYITFHARAFITKYLTPQSEWAQKISAERVQRSQWRNKKEMAICFLSFFSCKKQKLLLRVNITRLVCRFWQDVKELAVLMGYFLTLPGERRYQDTGQIDSGKLTEAVFMFCKSFGTNSEKQLDTAAHNSQMLKASSQPSLEGCSHNHK